MGRGFDPHRPVPDGERAFYFPAMSETAATFELEITSLAFGGEGVGRHDGMVVMVRGTVPGDRVRVRLVRREKNLLRAQVEEILQAGPFRVDPPCRWYGQCGGCQYQHLDYATELMWKERQVRETLQRIGKISDPPVQSILGSPEPYGYRNRITVHIRDGAVGFLGVDGRTLVPVEFCLLAEEAVNDELHALRHRPPPQRERWTLRAGDVEGHAFYQANRFLLDELRRRVAAAVREIPARGLIEGFCGVGFFTEVLAPYFEQTIGMELTPRAAALAEAKCLPGTRILQGRCEDLWCRAWEEMADQESVIALVDPPRQGLAAELVAGLLSCPLRRLVYLSCNPATLARDVARLAPRWRLTRVEPVDLFPRTAHVECLAVLDPVSQG